MNVPTWASDLTLNATTRTVERGGREITLSAKEYDILEYMIYNTGVVLSREKIDDPFPTKLIQTVRGFGYRLREEREEA